MVLVCSFVAVLLFSLIDMINNKPIKVILILCVVYIGLFSNHIFNHPLPFAISQAFVGVGFIFSAFCSTRVERCVGLKKESLSG